MQHGEQKNMMVFSSQYFVSDVGPRSVASLFYAVSVTVEHLAAQHRVFIAETYFKNVDCVVCYNTKTELLLLGHQKITKISISVLFTLRN
jgi:hypothetical protein